MRELEAEIAEWRSFAGESRAVDGRDIEELEDHLRSQITDLKAVGLADDEAFLVAVKRIGAVDAVSAEFAREHSGRLWRQLTASGESGLGTGAWRALWFALATSATVLIALLAGGFPEQEPAWLARNASLLVLPFLALYFAGRRTLTLRQSFVTTLPFILFAVVVNLYAYDTGSSTELLVAAHLPVLLWFVVAYPYSAGELGSHERRMDFVRFTGEWFIYYVLLGLGGAVLLALTTFILEPAGVDAERIVEWALPTGGAGAVIVAAWLVESKQRVVENMAPVLTMIFTPLFAVMLSGAAVVYAFTGLGAGFDRELLGVFDALMVVVLGLVLYGISARDPSAPPGWPDRIRLITVIAALALDLVVLAAMLGRIADLGITPNRAAALGINLLLLVNLAGTAWRSVGFLAGQGTFHQLERWQTGYLPLFPAWAALVVVAFPPLFGFS